MLATFTRHTNTMKPWWKYWVIVLLSAVALRTAASAQNSLIDSLAAQVQAAEPRQDTTFVLLLNELSYANWGTSPQRCVEYASRAAQIAERIGFPRGQAIAHTNMGWGWYMQGEYPKAMESYLRAQSIAEQLDTKVLFARVLQYKAIIYRLQKDPERAVKEHLRALDLMLAAHDSTYLGELLEDIGIDYRFLGNPVKGREFLFKALPYFERAYDSINICAIYAYVGECDFLLKEYEHSIQSHQYSLVMSSKIQFIRGLAFNFSRMAHVFNATGHSDSAVIYGLKAIPPAEQVRSRDQLREAYKALAMGYAGQKNFAKAYEYQERFTMLQDTLLSDNTRTNLALQQTDYEVQKRETQIHLLDKQNELRNVVILSFFGAILSLIVLLALMVNRSRLQRRSASALQATNSQIVRQKELLENSTTEIQQQNVEIHSQNQILTEQTLQLAAAFSELDAAHKRLIYQNQQLSDLNYEKNEFMGIAAHDLKNPLAAIQMTVSMLLRYRDKTSPEEIERKLGTILVVIERMTGIITNLLEVNALESGTMNLTPTAVDIAVLVEQIADDYRERAVSKGITIHVHAQTPTLYAFADKTAIIGVLENLISNALKYSPHERNVFLRVRISERGARVEVQDEGPGLSDEDKTKLFGKFARLSAQPTGSEHSTGLGLSIVKKLVEAMNGRVWCESELGQGATFVVELPVVEGVTTTE